VTPTLRHARRLPATAIRPALVLAAAAVLAQILYPLLGGPARDRLTVVTVLLFCAASLASAAATRTVRWAATFLLLTAGTGLLAESAGTRTGFPFGDYAYADSLGASLLDVPLVIPLAWTMMAYPALLVGRRLARSRVRSVLVAGWALASWDLFLDPQMVAAGHWRWSSVGAGLPGVPEVPLTNYLGWLTVAVAMMGLVDAVLPATTSRYDDRLPYGLYLWTYASSVLANLAFFGRPAVAVWGGIGMGLVALPLIVALRTEAQQTSAAPEPHA